MREVKKEEEKIYCEIGYKP